MSRLGPHLTHDFDDFEDRLDRLNDSIRDALDEADTDTINGSTPDRFHMVVRDLVKDLYSSVLRDATYFARYCSVTSSHMTDTDSTDGTFPLVSPGQPISLTSLAPKAGSTLPSLDLNNVVTGVTTHLSTVTLPDSAVITYRWRIRTTDSNNPLNTLSYSGDVTDPAKPTEIQFAADESTPTTSPSDELGTFNIVDGDLASPVLRLVPRPQAAPTLDSNGKVVPSSLYQCVEASLEVIAWWPDIKISTIVSNTLTSVNALRPVAMAVPTKLYATIGPFTVPDPILQDAKQLVQYCSVTSTSMKAVDGLTAFPLVSAGQPVTLTALLPGMNIPSGQGSSVPGFSDLASTLTSAVSLPPNAVVKFKWHIKVVNSDNLVNSISTASKDAQGNPTKKPNVSFPVDSQDARPGTTSADEGGCFELVSGNLDSAQLTITPWPDPTPFSYKSADLQTSTLGPSKTYRCLQAWVDISVWWPDIKQMVPVNGVSSSLPAPGPVTFSSPNKLYCTVNSWANTMTGAPDSTLKFWLWTASVPKALSVSGSDAISGLLGDNANSSPDLHFKDLFKIALDTATPAVGKAAALTLSKTDVLSSLPKTITNIVQTNPSVDVQAGIDAGAILAAIPGIGQTITGNSNAGSGIADSAAALSVQKVMNSVLRIPLAVAINGTSTANTILPNNPVKLADLTHTGDLSSLVGAVPIGNLTTRVEAAAKDLSIFQIGAGGTEMTPDKNIFQTSPLAGGVGLSILPLPEFGALRTDGSVQLGSLLNLKIKIGISLIVPGSNQPIKILVDLGAISLHRPLIPIPQCAMLFPDSLKGNDANRNQDVLITPDPVLWSLYPSADKLVTALGNFSKVVSKLKELLPLDLLKTALPGWSDLIEVLGYMTTMLSTNANSLHVLEPYEDGNKWRVIYRDHWEDKDDSSVFTHHGQNISAVLWIGAPSATTDLVPTSAGYSPDYQMALCLDNFKRWTGNLMFPNKYQNPQAQVATAIYSTQAQDIGPGIVYRARDGDKGTFSNADVTSSEFNDHIKGIWWWKGNSLNRTPESITPQRGDGTPN